MAHIKLPEFEEMSPAIQDKARPILEKTGKLGEIFKLLAIDEKVYFATDVMIQKYLLDETSLSYEIKESIALLNFCIKASKKESYKILKEELDALKKMGYSDTQIIEAVAITGYFNYINTLSNVFGLGQ